MQKKVLVNIATGVFLIVAVAFLAATINGWDYRKYIGLNPAEIKTEVEDKPQEVIHPKVGTEKVKQDILLDYKGKTNKYMLIVWLHEMANTVVIAEDDLKWGFREINKENLNIVYNTAKALPNDDSDKERFEAIIGRWLNKDFSNIAEEHNIFWLLLGGNVGKATGINQEAVKAVISNLK